MKNAIIHTAPDPFAIDYIEAVESVASPRILSIGPMVPAGPWAGKMHLLTGETAPSYLNLVIAPMGMQLGTAKSVADFAPDDGELNPQLAAQNPDLIAAGNQARERKHLTAYTPETALKGRFAPDQKNVAVLRPIRAKRAQLAVDLEILERYDLVVAPSDTAHLFRELGVRGAIGCDPSSFAVTIEPFLS